MTYTAMESVSLYGCGVVSPMSAVSGSDRSGALSHFLNALWKKGSSLERSQYFQGNTLVGNAQFDFNHYKDWITRKVNEKRFVQLQKSGGQCVQFAMGAFIDALSSNEPALENLMGLYPNRVSCLIGTGLGDLEANSIATEQLAKAQFQWNKFWGKTAAAEALEAGLLPDTLQDPRLCDDELERFEATAKMYGFFAEKNPELHDFLSAYESVERVPLKAGETSLINQLKAKGTERIAVRKKFGCPLPPWESVSANVLWNIPNLAAAQISMMIGSHGFTGGLSGACSTFAMALRAGLDEIKLGRADIAIVGATDVNPRPEIIAAFQGARVGAYGSKTVFPLTELRGTHLAGGACVWILCRDELARSVGLKSLGVKVRGVAVTSDGEHVITPSADGPSYAIRMALDQSGCSSKDIQSWDLHCTGTPGDTQELEHVKGFASNQAVLSARKGIFGHGMAACGGWELTAQLLAPRFEKSMFILPPTSIQPEDVSPAILEKGLNLLLDKPLKVAPTGQGSLLTAKLNMGVGGVSSCVVCERFESVSGS